MECSRNTLGVFVVFSLCKMVSCQQDQATVTQTKRFPLCGPLRKTRHTCEQKREKRKKPGVAITAKHQLLQDPPPHQHLEPPERSSLPGRVHILLRVPSYILLNVTNEDFLRFRLSRETHRPRAPWSHTSYSCSTQHHDNIIQRNRG